MESGDRGRGLRTDRHPRPVDRRVPDVRGDLRPHLPRVLGVGLPAERSEVRACDRGVPLCEGLKKSYPGFVLGPLSLEVAHGSVVGLFGPNGSGKTTLLLMLLGLVRPTEGRALFPLADVSASMEGTGLLGDVTVSDYLSATAGITARSGVERDVARTCGIDSYMGTRVRHLSMGNRQRLMIALMLVEDAGLMVFDEPLNGLDPEGIRWFSAVLRDLKERGKTVILSSHLLQEVESFIDACIFLRRGRLLYDGEFSRLRELVARRLRAPAPGPTGAAGGASPRSEYGFAYDDGRRIVVDPGTRTDSGAPGAEPGLEPVDGAAVSLQTAYAWLSHQFETSGAEGWEPPR